MNKLINIFKKRKTRKTFSVILSLALFFGGYRAYAEDLTSVKLSVNDEWRLIKTSEDNVGEFLSSLNINLGEKDIINLSLDTKISKDLKVIIKTAKNVTFKFTSGETKDFVTNAENIGKAVNELSQVTGKSYKLAEGQSSASEIKDGMNITLLVYEEVYKTTQQEIAYSSQTVENNQILKGTTTIKTAGVNGVKEITTKEEYLDGKLINSETSENILTNPINEVIEIGTKEEVLNTISTEKGTFIVDKEYNMKSSAYTSSVECTGKTPGSAGYGITASGIKAQYGVVAVDPKVIPLGTKLYIEGYGYAIAGDTGGAIKGNKVDLYFNTYSEAINYGVRQVKVYVLGKQI